MKFVGIDFGHGEVSSSFFDGEQLKRLRLVLTTTENPDMYKIPSYLYKCEGEEKNSFYYSLEEHSPCSLISGMKKPISNMTDEEKEQYQIFIQLIYQRLLECNQELLADGAFELAIACPTKWDQEKKAEYKAFFEKALGKSIYAIMNESDAAYFAKRTNDESGSSTLVVDYGSSTIDFTLVREGNKVEDDGEGVRFDDWSSSDLGASSIEDRIFDLYKHDKSISPTYNEISAAVMQILVSTKPDRSWIDYNAFIKKNIREFKEQIFTLRKEYFTGPIYYRPATHNGCDEPDESQSLEFEYVVKERILEIPGIKDYIEAVKAHFKRVHGATGDVDKIILSGGAACMVWVSEALKDEFGQKTTIVLDSKPAYVVCDGIVKYCYERQKCLETYLKEIEQIDIEKIYKDSDVKAINKLRYPILMQVLEAYISTDSKTSWNDLTGEIWNKCFEPFNEKNEEYKKQLQLFFKENVTKEVLEYLYKIINKTFGVELKYDKNKKVETIFITPESVSAFSYKTIHYLLVQNKLEALIPWNYRVLMTQRYWNRNKEEREEIVANINEPSNLQNFLDIEKSIPISVKDEQKKLILEEILSYAKQLFDEMELFKTRFTARTNKGVSGL